MMKKNILRIAIQCLSTACLLSGCLNSGPINQSTPANSTGAEIKQTPSANASITQIVPTGSPEDHSNIFTATPEIQALTDTILYCEAEGVNIYPHQGYGFDGDIVYLDRQSNKYYLIGNTPLNKKLLNIPASDNTHLVGFSPNGDKLLFITGNIFKGEPSQIHVFDANGEEQVLDVQETNLSMPTFNGQGVWPNLHWINDDLILVRVFSPNKDDPTSSRIAVLNINTGQWQNQYYLGISTYDVNRGVSFSPNLSLAASIDRSDGIVVWDIKNQKEIVSLPGIIGPSQIISWSPNSSWLAFVGMDKNNALQLNLSSWIQNVYLLNRNANEIKQITDYYSVFRAFYPEHLTWSPDGNYLAFDANISIAGEASRQTLFIYDLSSAQIKPFCWQYGGSLNTTTSELIWSPDSKLIAYANSSDVDPQQPSPLYVIDLENGSVKQIVESAKNIGGWSTKFQ